MFGLMLESTHNAVVRDLRCDVVAAEKSADKARSANDELRQNNYALDRTAAKYKAERDALQAKLDKIAGMETPNCAHIGKKMAAVAKEGV